MAKAVTGSVKRVNFANIEECFDIPNLVAIQTDSYADFLQSDVPKSKRKNTGLQGAFNETFPIESSNGESKLEFVNYSVGKPKYDKRECVRRGVTFAAPLKVKLRLRTKKDSKEQEVYMGDLPLMTETGTFIINGDERVAVSQLHRSPGVSFKESLHPNCKKMFSARIIPYRGAWIEFEIDINDIIYVYIDRRRKFLASTFLRAVGYGTDDKILDAFYEKSSVSVSAKPSGEEGGLLISAEEVKSKSGGETLLAPGESVTKEKLQALHEAGISKISAYKAPTVEMYKTLLKDHSKIKDDALIDIYRKLRPGDPPTAESAQGLIDRLFFDPKRYELGKVGRFMLNRKLGMNLSLDKKVLTADTVINVIKYLLNLKNGEGAVDDIDHLGNRRVRSVGELVQNQFRIGLSRIERSARERMGVYDMSITMPHHLVNSKLISSIIKDFFGRSQLSQFMDQTNPLAELTHKRRLSALGPGGLTRESAGFEVRDVHHSHYGRICPIETPEGPNIGLIASLSTYARINEFGFVETPYRRVDKGKATRKIEYLSADIEDQYAIAQANAVLTKAGHFKDDLISCRYRGNFPRLASSKIHYMDVSPRQLVSIAAGLIPFLEHDDANRALMGSNMQRQAVPLLEPEAPLVGTGMELKVASDSGASILAENSGTVRYVDAKKITISNNPEFHLTKFNKSNANTCINQRPLVKVGQKVKEGEVIADGPATKQGELALGKNVLVAFMPWRGYNFEDAIVVSERLIKEDIYTSVHLEEFEIDARDTRLGNEEITRDIPNVGEDALKDLDEDGIVRLGAEVGPGDILVGKVTPKSETELSSEEKLLRAIFGEKAGDVRDASLKVPPGLEGIVVDVKVFSRKENRGRSKDDTAAEHKEIAKIAKNYELLIDRLVKEKTKKLEQALIGKKLNAELLDEDTGEVIISSGKTIGKKDIKNILVCDIDSLRLSSNTETEDRIKRSIKLLNDQIEELSYEQEREIDSIKRGDEMPP
ncbi:MAG: DNA-directed RNA polymerase subunit beta, partial [Candidatus Omnitrophica bacterium CG1_02_49_10]